jgi:hypothetical protein
VCRKEACGYTKEIKRKSMLKIIDKCPRKKREREEKNDKDSSCFLAIVSKFK